MCSQTGECFIFCFSLVKPSYLCLSLLKPQFWNHQETCISPIIESTFPAFCSECVFFFFPHWLMNRVGRVRSFVAPCKSATRRNAALRRTRRRFRRGGNPGGLDGGKWPVACIFHGCLEDSNITLWWTNIAMENGHRNSGFTHEIWWFSIAMLVHQRVMLFLMHVC